MRLIAIILSVILISCSKHRLPKPYGYMRMEYPEAKYSRFQSNCPFEFDLSDFSTVQEQPNKCWYNIIYPEMMATIYLTYIPVKKNLKTLVKETEKLVYKHTIKASYINEQIFAQPWNKTYGMLYELGGESASNLQFFLTDSRRHFLSGALYFRVTPDEEAMRPVIDYLKKDIQHLMESLHWK